MTSIIEADHDRRHGRHRRRHGRRQLYLPMFKLISVGGWRQLVTLSKHRELDPGALTAALATFCDRWDRLEDAHPYASAGGDPALPIACLLAPQASPESWWLLGWSLIAVACCRRSTVGTRGCDAGRSRRPTSSWSWTWLIVTALSR